MRYSHKREAIQDLRNTYNQSLTALDTELKGKYAEFQSQGNDPKTLENQVKELQLEMEQKQKAAEKIYVESVINLDSPIKKEAYIAILNQSKNKYAIMKNNPTYQGLFNKNSFPQELLLYWDAQ